MIYTIKNAKVIDPLSSWNGKIVDVIIEKGKIHSIGKNLKSKGQEISAKGLHISPGWIDMHAEFCDPGLEYKEDLKSGLAAAKCGGFTSVVTVPSTLPPVDSKSGVEYILSKSQNTGVRVYPAACISKQMNGTELSEMVDLSQAGARLFTDNKAAIADSGLMSRALLYARNTSSTICSFPQDPHLSKSGKMNEGITSTKMGVTGVPHLAETILLKRDLDLLRYTESSLHVVGLSTAEGVKLIKEAKKEGLNVTAEVHLANLLWTDDKLSNYDTNYKLNPPLRTNKDRKALIKGVKDGTIDCISSDHSPEDVEHKKVEFGSANTGISLIETFFPLYNSSLREELDIEEFVKAITYGPCKVLNIRPASIEKGKRAILTCFSDKEKAVQLPTATKAYNTPCINEAIKGTVITTIR